MPHSMPAGRCQILVGSVALQVSRGLRYSGVRSNENFPSGYFQALPHGDFVGCALTNFKVVCFLNIVRGRALSHFKKSHQN